MTSPRRAAEQARRQIRALARPAGEFDASRYFRGPGDLGFYNVGADTVRRMARTIASEHAREWSAVEATTFADALMADRYLEVKGLGIETLARFKRGFTPRLLPIWKRWLARDHAANWATTDTLCGRLIRPLLDAHPELIPEMRKWSTHRNLWVRRASAVSLIALVHRGVALDLAYEIARRLHADREDLIQKAVGWLLREAGKTDSARLERYLRAEGPAMPRTTLRYAIERFPTAKRRQLLAATRGMSGTSKGERGR